MSLTVEYQGRNVRFTYSLKRRQLIAALVVCSSLLFIASRSLHTQPQHQHQVNQTHALLEIQKQQVEALKSNTEQKLLGVMMKLADAQSQLQRINAVGAQIAENAGLDSDAIDFQAPIPMGGSEITATTDQVPPLSNMLEDIDRVIEHIDHQQNQLKALESVLIGHHVSDEMRISGRPVNSGWLSSYFGIRKDPFSGMPAMHKGLDFAGKSGDSVVATGAGIVVWSGERYGYGNLIEVDHGDGLRTRYAHNKSLSVSVGEVVVKGQQLAIMGSTGRSTGAHVHYEVIKNGVQKDPLYYVSRKP